MKNFSHLQFCFPFQVFHHKLHNKVICFVLLALSVYALVASAQPPDCTYQTGVILKWENKPYSQSANIIRKQIVYTVKLEGVMSDIARRSEKVEFAIGQRIQCRTEKKHIFVINVKGHETKYDILGSTL